MKITIEKQRDDKGQRRHAYNLVVGRILPDDPAPELPNYTDPHDLPDNQLTVLTYIDQNPDILQFRKVLGLCCVMANHLQVTIQSNKFEVDHLFDGDLQDPMVVDSDPQEEGAT